MRKPLNKLRVGMVGLGHRGRDMSHMGKNKVNYLNDIEFIIYN